MFVPYLTSLHVLLQVAAGLIIMKLVPAYYKSSSKGKKPGSSVNIFWANVFFAAILAVLFVCLDLFLIVSVYSGVDDAIGAITSNNRSALETVFAFGMLGALVSFILVVLQFIVAAGIPKNTWLYVPGALKLLCCFFHCRCPCKKANGEFWHKVLQTFSIWFLMVFLQLVAGSLIPYLVLAIVNPVPSVTFLALGASTLFCLIVFVASILQVGSQNKHWTCYEKIVAVVQGLVFIVFLGLVAITVIIYQGVIQSGTNTGVVSGIILSLVPSGIIAVLGLAVKSKLLSDGDDEGEESPKKSLFSRASKIFRSKILNKLDPEGEGGKSDKEATSVHNGETSSSELKNSEADSKNIKAPSPSNEMIDSGHETIKSTLDKPTSDGEEEKGDEEPKTKSLMTEGSSEPDGIFEEVSRESNESGGSALDANQFESTEALLSTAGDDCFGESCHNEMAEVWLKLDFREDDDDEVDA